MTIPADACSATFSFWLRIATQETATASAFDRLTVDVQSSTGATLATLATFSNLDASSTYVLRSFDLAAFKGQTIRVHFLGTEDASRATSFLVDDASVSVTR